MRNILNNLPVAPERRAILDRAQAAGLESDRLYSAHRTALLERADARSMPAPHQKRGIVRYGGHFGLHQVRA